MSRELKPDSPLAGKYMLTEHRTSPRAGQIKGLTLHDGPNWAAEVLARYMDEYLGRTSAHYIVGTSGEIVQCVPEADRSWSTGGPQGRRQFTPPEWTGIRYDHWSVSIWFASHLDQDARMNGRTFESVVRLSADILKRNGIPKMLWENSPELVGQWDRQNVVHHCFFTDLTQCPGPWLKENMDRYVSEVNRLLESPA